MKSTDELNLADDSTAIAVDLGDAAEETKQFWPYPAYADSQFVTTGGFRPG